MKTVDIVTQLFLQGVVDIRGNLIASDKGEHLG